MVREQGTGSKLFYYTLSGEYTTFNMRQELFFKEEVDREVFAECVEDTLMDFPEFAVRPVIRDERVCYEENRNEPVVLEKDGAEETRRYFGTDDTNGYLFYFLCDGCRVMVSYFHGMTDDEGMEAFLDCILYRYGERKGILTEEDRPPAVYAARCESDTLKELADCSDGEIDPFGHLTAALGLVPEIPKMPEPAFFIPREEGLVNSYRVRVWDIETTRSAYQALAQEGGASMQSVFLPVVCSGIAEAYDLSEERVTATLSIDLREVYSLDTAVNFTDGIFFAQDGKMRKEPLAEQMKAAEDFISGKKGREHFDVVIAQKVAAVKGLEMMQPVSGLNPVPLVGLPEGGMTPVSYALSCPQRKQGYSFLDHVEFAAAVSSSLSVMVYTAGEKVVVRCIMKSDDEKPAKSIAAVMTGAGMHAEVKDHGYLAGDVLLTGWLKKV